MAGAGYTLFTAGQTLTAAQVNTYLEQQTMMVFASAAARDTALASVLAEGLHCYLLDVNTVTVYSGAAWSTVGPVHGTLTSFTPTITQGVSVSCTVAYARYSRVGRWLHGSFNLSVTGSGTAANNVVIGGLPTAVFADVVVGAGWIFSGGSIYTGLMYELTTTTFTFRDTTVANAGTLGASVFTGGLVSGNTINATFAFECAADA